MKHNLLLRTIDNPGSIQLKESLGSLDVPLEHQIQYKGRLIWFAITKSGEILSQVDKDWKEVRMFKKISELSKERKLLIFGFTDKDKENYWTVNLINGKFSINNQILMFSNNDGLPAKIENLELIFLRRNQVVFSNNIEQRRTIHIIGWKAGTLEKKLYILPNDDILLFD